MAGRVKGSRPAERPDEDLVAGLAASEPDAASAFVRRFQRRVFGLALSIVGDVRAAEGVAQKAFVRAWRHADGFDARRGSVAAWLLSITRSLAIDAVCASRPDAVATADVGLEAQTTSGRDQVEGCAPRDDVARVYAALSELPEEQRRAVLLARVWGCSARDIAAREGIPLETAKTRIRAGIRRLRPALTTAEPCSAARA